MSNTQDLIDAVRELAKACAEIEKLTTERDELRAKLEGGVRVEVYRDRFGELRAHQMRTGASSEATLILDDGAEI